MTPVTPPGHLPEAVLGPVLDLRTPRPRRSSADGLRRARIGRRRRGRRGFPPAGDGEASLAAVPQADPGQEVGGDVLRFDPRAGAHFGLPSLVEGHEPVAGGAAVAVQQRGVGVVAVLLEALPEAAVVREALLWEKRSARALPA